MEIIAMRTEDRVSVFKPESALALRFEEQPTTSGLPESSANSEPACPFLHYRVNHTWGNEASEFRPIDNEVWANYNSRLLHSFRLLIQRRKGFIDTLHLSEGQGGFVPPTASVIKAMKRLLDLLLVNAVSKVEYFGNTIATGLVPSILLGVIPDGGLTLKIGNPDNAVYLSLFNTIEPEVSIERHGFLEDVEVTKEDIVNQIIQHYASLEG